LSSNPADTASPELLTGWGRTMPSRAIVVHPRTVEDVSAALTSAGPRGVLARGAGRSYGDAAQNGGGTVLDLTALADVELIEGGDVIAGAGVLLADLVPVLLAAGRFLPVTPGTRFVTVGGALAADVHGKNHHVDGSLGDHVRRLDLVTPDGATHALERGGSRWGDRLLDATLGGMGLTGVITSARLATIPAPTPWIVVDTRRADDLDELMSLMSDPTSTHRYSVAWIDGTARGARLGRGVLTLGDHASTDHARGRTGSGVPAGAPRFDVPPLPVSPLGRLSITAFNEAWFRKAPRSRDAELVGIAPYFYPLDAVGGWNRLYGPHGFLQYQFAVPDSGADVVRRTLERLVGIGAPSFLSVLKRFGPGRASSPLSFPLEGWTLAVDVPTRVPGLARALDELDDAVLAAGGRHYLAKDSRAVPATIEAGYPGLADFRALRREIDPRGVLVSDLSRRLQL
jgi:decaprenylphospho-beta-D-ribofuranose 2-oxidase